MSKRRGGPTSRQQSQFMQRFSGKLTTTTPSGEHRRIGGGDDSNKKNNRSKPRRGKNMLNQPGGYGNNNNNNINNNNKMMPPQGNAYNSFAPPPGALPPANGMMGRPGVNDLRNVAMEQPMGFDYGDNGMRGGMGGFPGGNAGGNFVYQMPNGQNGGGRNNNMGGGRGGGMGRPMASAGARRRRGGRGGRGGHNNMQHNKPQRPGTFHGYQRRENRNEELANSSPNGQLYFSRQSRQVNFRPKTLAEYKRLQPNEYVELGKLPADLNSTELIAKRANKERVKDFSRNLRAINQRMIRQARSRKPKAKSKKLSTREKARMYAQNIPKPRGFNRDTPLSRMSRKENINDGYDDEQENDQYNGMDGYGIDNNMSQLDQLEMEHQNSRYDVDAIRREYGF